MLKKIFSFLFVLLLVVSFSLVAAVPTAQAAVAWTAYNDCSGTTGGNTTTYSYSGTTTGLLKDYDTGVNTSVTVTITKNGSISTSTTNGAYSDSGTDAYNTFYGKANMQGVINYASSTGWWIDITFTNLDQTKTYTFATTANRNDATYTTRNSKFTLSDVDTTTLPTNASTSGVTKSTTSFTDDTTVFCTGYNTVNGYVARWTGIHPGSDGDFTVRVTHYPDTSYYGYGPSVFMLQEEVSTSPTITISGTPLSDFSSEPGTPSAEQDYTVSGSNLTGDITITPPPDFELSLTSGSGFGTSPLVLPQSGGSVTATPIYVRFNRATEGTSSGNITHTSSGATTQNVAVSGTASYTSTVTFQEGVSSYAGTVDTFIMENEPTTINGNETWVEWDKDDPFGTGKSNFSLIRFDNIFGPGANQIPTGATIVLATLTYYVQNTGDLADVNEVAIDWAEDVTYNGFGADAGVQEADYGNSVGTALGDSTGSHTLDVTASLAAWSSNPSANHGWVFRPTDDDGVEFRSSENATVSDRPLLTVTYSTGTPPNHAPDAPVLVQPLDDATGVSTSPTLEVTVTDPDSDTMDVTFYGREVGGGTGEDFTIVVIPDTQNEATSYPTVFNNQIQWIANNKSAQNIVFATHVGDIVNTASSTTEWEKADTAMDYLDTGNVAYSVGPGNHDIGGLYETYFGVSRFSGKSWYGGHYGSDNYNNYSLFSAGGMEFILINLQYSSTSAMRDWADDLLKTYSDRRGIVVQHDLLNINDTWYNQTPYNELRDNPNLFLMLCGHMHSASDGAAYLAGSGTDAHTIHVMLADYQDYPNGGNGYLRILRFSPADDTIYATTYSYTGESITSYPDQMTMAYDMEGSAVFTVIDTVTGVASGSNAFISWPDLDPNTEYEWYVDVSDGSDTTTGSTWSFTTTQNIYTVTFDKNGGDTDPSPTFATTTYDGTVTLPTTNPTKLGYTFASWNTASNGSGSTFTASTHVTADITVYAQYTQDEYTLTVNISGSGTVDKAPDQTTYHYGDVVILTATADPGWTFSAWSGDGTGTAPGTRSVTMDGNKTVNATFVTEAGILGDVNGDGLVNSTDALIILSCDVGLDTSLFCPMNCGDVNGDGLVNSTDALIILSYDVGIPVPFPVGETGCPSSVTPCAGCAS